MNPIIKVTLAPEPIIMVSLALELIIKDKLMFIKFIFKVILVKLDKMLNVMFFKKKSRL